MDRMRLPILGSMWPKMLVMIGIIGGWVKSSGHYHYFVRHFKVPLYHMENSVWIHETSSPGLYVANDVRLVMMGCTGKLGWALGACSWQYFYAFVRRLEVP